MCYQRNKKNYIVIFQNILRYKPMRSKELLNNFRLKILFFSVFSVFSGYKIFLENNDGKGYKKYRRTYLAF